MALRAKIKKKKTNPLEYMLGIPLACVCGYRTTMVFRVFTVIDSILRQSVFGFGMNVFISTVSYVYTQRSKLHFVYIHFNRKKKFLVLLATSVCSTSIMNTPHYLGYKGTFLWSFPPQAQEILSYHYKPY